MTILIQIIEDEQRVDEFIIFTSVDTWGEQAEYIRNGLEFNRFWDNVNKILEKCSRVNLTMMSTYNALSVPNYDKLIEGVYDLKKQYGSSDRYWNSAVFLDSDIEVQKLKRIYDWHLSRDEKDMTEQRRNFFRFFSEHDRRRNTDFCKVFPELESFYRDCEKLC